MQKVLGRYDRRISDRYRSKLVGGSSLAVNSLGVSSARELERAQQHSRALAGVVNEHHTVFTKWTAEMDELLLSAFEMYGKNWSNVAAHMNLPDITNEKCRKRMNVLERRKT